MIPAAIGSAVVLVAGLIAYALLRAGAGKEAPKPTDRVPISGTAEKTPAPVPERRRSERMLCRMPVFVYGHTPEKEPFYEEATTNDVSERGGRITLAAAVAVGQKLLLTNTFTQENQECRVVRWTGPPAGELAFEFAQPAPTFWQTPSAAFRVVKIVDDQN